MKKIVLMLLACIVTLSMILGGCASETKAPAVDQEAPAKGPEFVLKYNEFCPEIFPPSIVAKAAAERIEERSGGRIKMEMYFSESLLTYSDTLMGTASGVADITMIASPQLQGIHDLNMIFDTLFEVEAPDRDGLTKAFRELLEKYPQLQDELEAKGTRWLCITSLAPYQLNTTEKLVKVPADLRGLKLEVDGTAANWVNSMGAAAVSLPVGDYYMSLERGLVAGQFQMWPAMLANNLVPLFKHHLVFGEDVESGVFSHGYGWMINLETWNKLPEDLQMIITEEFKKAGEDLISGDVAAMEQAVSDAKTQGNTFTHLTPDERELWVEYMKPVNEEWVKKCEAKGYPAQEMLDELWRLFEKYR